MPDDLTKAGDILHASDLASIANEKSMELGGI
ncbi:uncharacterized protein FFB20_04523 [Fusarium fujikuroi]|nr:uncharacterized protein FFE2_01609 [Fusarium fujikuroi]SCN72763.1 uncharacterized protein FFC1_01603 [Fusarium fujikuroi]SCN74331.1 uncharacterized protein FFB20_04523 [Fusarium fujikuroi]SCN75804.1 uncharacterized protein FFM5_01556 [Fusarium fujikuroi]SCO27747.1 uncharacterized protein FFMR_00627 [Fusarium fujikuroi]